MLIYLDKRDKLKVKLIQIFMQNKGQHLSLRTLQETIGVSGATLQILLDEVLQELQEMQLSVELWKKKDGNTLYYQLVFAGTFSLNIVLHHYVTRSLKFQLMEEIFYGTYHEHEQMAEKYFISTSTLRREVGELKAYLQENGLSLTGYNQLRVTGEEAQVRLFFADFFLTAYQGMRWPFKAVLDFQTAKTACQLINEELVTDENVKIEFFLLYFLVIGIIRFRQGETLAATELAVPLVDNPSFETVRTGKDGLPLDTFLSIYQAKSLAELATELQFIRSVTCAFSTVYHRQVSLPAFFYQNEGLRQSVFYQRTQAITQQLFACLQIKGAQAIYSQIFKQVMLIHYRFMLLGRGSRVLERVSLFKDATASVFYQRVQQVVVSGIKEPCLTELTTTDRQYLLTSYTNLAFGILKLTRLEKKVRVLIMADTVNHRAITTQLLSSVANRVCAIEFLTLETTCQPDLIVSDILLNLAEFSLPATIPFIYFDATNQASGEEQLVECVASLRLPRVSE